MNIGFDYWQVISHYPVQFKKLNAAYNAMGWPVFIVSAVGKEREGTVEAAVRKLGFDNPVYEVVFDDPTQSPALKLEACQELGIEMFYDDRDDVCRVLNRNGILGMRVTRKDNSKYDVAAEQGAKPLLVLGNLMGPEGNAFVILGRAKVAAQAYGMGWDAIRKDAESSDYGHLLKVMRKHFSVQTDDNAMEV